MSKIINLFNSGKKSVKTGVVNINARNVYPTTIVATPTTGTTMGLELLDGYDAFTIAQTSAGTDFITLPNAPVGTNIELYAVSACKVQGANSDTINGVAPTTDISIAAGAIAVLRRNTETTWKLTHIASNGALTAPTS